MSWDIIVSNSAKEKGDDDISEEDEKRSSRKLDYQGRVLFLLRQHENEYLK
jgi:hypothetical protein